MKHDLDFLLRPKSVVVVGASEKKDSMGFWLMKNLQRGGFKGKIFPVNPGYDLLNGTKCFSFRNSA